jgi:uncharacterized membrane protein YkvA (DUF1232 family)
MAKGPDFAKKLLRWVVGIATIAAGLTYLFLPVDVIPDSVTLFGFLDDTIIGILVFIIGNWITKKLTGFTLFGRKAKA